LKTDVKFNLEDAQDLHRVYRNQGGVFVGHALK